MVEGDRYPRGLAMKHSKLTAIGFPGKGYDGFYNQQQEKSVAVIFHSKIFNYEDLHSTGEKYPETPNSLQIN